MLFIAGCQTVSVKNGWLNSSLWHANSPPIQHYGLTNCRKKVVRYKLICTRVFSSHTHSCPSRVGSCRIPEGKLRPIRTALHGALAEGARQHWLSFTSFIHSLPVSPIRQVSNWPHSQTGMRWSHSQTGMRWSHSKMGIRD